jgi:phosphoribosylglycinamide formyltransferase-1
MVARTGPRPLRVALLTTDRAPGLEALCDDPDRGTLYQVVMGLVTQPLAGAARVMADAGIPCAVHNLREFCREQGGRLGDLELRRRFDARTARFLRPYRPDLILLDAYLHVLTGPMLEAFPGRILNLHDADLGILGPDGRPRYRGLRATYDALAAGETETRTCVHLVTPEVDTGPVVLRSTPFPVSPMVAEARRPGGTRMLKAYAYAHREWMMRVAWGPLLQQTIRLFAAEPSRHAAESPSRRAARPQDRRAYA